MMATKMMHLLSTSLDTESGSQGLDNSWKDVKGDDDLKRSVLEQTFRSLLTTKFLSTSEQLQNPDLNRIKNLVEMAIFASKSGLCNPTLPHVLLSDVFDLLTLDAAEILFKVVESNVKVWKDKQFFASGRNLLLRICNDLLRRLSRPQNTVFCGRILLFLAKFFPISERSGLNVISEFNLDNTTAFSPEEEEEGAGMEMEEKEAIAIEEDQKNLNIDYSLYKKFWQLQDFFRCPTQCYDKAQWKIFSSQASDVLATFKSFKLDSIAGKKKAAERIEGEKSEQYFAKYLTNQNLLQLQLSDSNFRRFILLQFLVLFQYLQSTVKFKGDTDVLSDDQTRWLTNATARVFDLIQETPPNGKEFSASVKHILQREEQWISWKNEGCPAFKPKTKESKEDAKESEENAKESEENAKPAVPVIGSSRKRKRKVGDQIQAAAATKKFLMGNVTLTKLWNRCPDNMEACAAPERDFLPDLGIYFVDAITQINPESGIESEYMKINDGAWGWRALRLMARKSPHFFTYGNHPIGKLRDYLEQMLWKMCQDSTFTQDDVVAVAAEAVAAKTRKDEGANNTTAAKEEDSASATPGLVTPDEMEKLGEKIGDQWVKMTGKLGIDKEALAEIQEKGENDNERAVLALKKWSDIEKEGASSDELLYILEGLKMQDLAEGILNKAAEK